MDVPRPIQLRIQLTYLSFKDVIKISLFDVGGLRGSNATSDHILMIVKVRMKLKAQERKSKATKQKQYHANKWKRS